MKKGNQKKTPQDAKLKILHEGERSASLNGANKSSKMSDNNCLRIHQLLTIKK